MTQMERPTTLALMIAFQQLPNLYTASALSLFGACLRHPSIKQVARTPVTHVALPAGHRLCDLRPRCSS
jgi:hypothetical protein